MSTLRIDGVHLTIEDVVAVARAWDRPESIRIALTPAARSQVSCAQAAVESLTSRGETVYGVTTGFGRFKDRRIEPEQTAELQRNILRSHAVGVGPLLDEGTVRAMMLLRANTLAKGHSGIRLETLETLIEMLNRGVHPVVPSQGSVGASGDLAPLAHMGLVLIGEGEAWYRGERLPGGEALRRAELQPVVLGAKEGVALTNGTALMTAIGALTVHAADELVRLADIAAAMSLEALHGTPLAFDARIHAMRPHLHQVSCAAHLRRLLEGSDFTRQPEDPRDIQDAYTLRCIPQVHGAVRDTIAYAMRVLSTELNAATDNPLLFVEGDQVACLSGGNFHGEPIALAMDFLALGLTELGNFSERRIARLMDADSNGGILPPFLTEHGGLHSGFMLVQYTAAALASENKVLAHPASADTIPTSANTEDHVSMGTTAARQAREVLGNVQTIIALELLCAAQGIDFRRKTQGASARLGRGTAPAYALIRRDVPFIERDTILYPYIEAMRQLVVSGELLRAVEGEVGPLAGVDVS